MWFSFLPVFPLFFFHFWWNYPHSISLRGLAWAQASEQANSAVVCSHSLKKTKGMPLFGLSKQAKSTTRVHFLTIRYEEPPSLRILLTFFFFLTILLTTHFRTSHKDYWQFLACAICAAAQDGIAGVMLTPKPGFVRCIDCIIGALLPCRILHGR